MACLASSSKTLVVGGFALVVSLLLAFTAFLLGQILLRRQHLNVAITDVHALRAVTCAGLYMTVVAMTGFGLAALLRHTAVAMSAMFGLVSLTYPIARTFEGTTYVPDARGALIAFDQCPWCAP